MGAITAPKWRGDRPTLTVLSDPLNEGWLAGLGLQLDQLNELRKFYKNLVRERNAFDINRHRGGLFVPAGIKLDKRDAERMLKQGIAALTGGDA